MDLFAAAPSIHPTIDSFTAWATGLLILTLVAAYILITRDHKVHQRKRAEGLQVAWHKRPIIPEIIGTILLMASLVVAAVINGNAGPINNIFLDVVYALFVVMFIVLWGYAIELRHIQRRSQQNSR